MRKFVLFTDDLSWKTPAGSDIRSAFGDTGLHFSAEHPVLFAGLSGKHCLPNDAAIAIAWEPDLEEGKYPDDGCVDIIATIMVEFLSETEACGLAIHHRDKPLIRFEQIKMVRRALGDAPMIERQYHHVKSPPYSLYCTAIATAGTTEFFESLRSLNTWFQPPEVPAHEILLGCLPDYLSGADVGPLPPPGSDDQWKRLGEALQPQRQAHEIRAEVLDAVGKIEGTDFYLGLCKAMMSVIEGSR